MIEEERDGSPNGTEGTEVIGHVRVAPNQHHSRPHFFLTITAYLLGLVTLLVGFAVLLNPIMFAKLFILPTSGTTISPATVSQAARPLTLMLGGNCIASGIATLSFVYQKRLRTLGTLLMCAMTAEIVTLYVGWKSGVRSDTIAGIMVAAFKGGLGFLMMRSG